MRVDNYIEEDVKNQIEFWKKAGLKRGQMPPLYWNLFLNVQPDRVYGGIEVNKRKYRRALSDIRKLAKIDTEAGPHVFVEVPIDNLVELLGKDYVGKAEPQAGLEILGTNIMPYEGPLELQVATIR